jgi:hypothetical protein
VLLAGNVVSLLADNAQDFKVAVDQLGDTGTDSGGSGEGLLGERHVAVLRRLECRHALLHGFGVFMDINGGPERLDHRNGLESLEVLIKPVIRSLQLGVLPFHQGRYLESEPTLIIIRVSNA